MPKKQQCGILCADFAQILSAVRSAPHRVPRAIIACSTRAIYDSRMQCGSQILVRQAFSAFVICAGDEAFKTMADVLDAHKWLSLVLLAREDSRHQSSLTR